jgi:hypothetical protein
MSLISRIKRLWELSGTFSHAEDTKTAAKLKKQHRLFKKKHRPAAIVELSDPLDVFGKAEKEPENDSTSERPPAN